jgi:hypothetical protein
VGGLPEPEPSPLPLPLGGGGVGDVGVVPLLGGELDGVVDVGVVLGGGVVLCGVLGAADDG